MRYTEKVNQLLSRVFAQRRKDGRTDLEDAGENHVGVRMGRLMDPEGVDFDDLQLSRRDLRNRANQGP